MMSVPEPGLELISIWPPAAKNDFGVRRLVAALALAQKQVLDLVAILPFGQAATSRRTPNYRPGNSKTFNQL